MITQTLTDGSHCAMDYNNGNYGNNDLGLLNLKATYDSENDVRTHLDASTNAILNGQSHITANLTTVSRDVLNAQSDIRHEIATNRFQLLQVNNDLSKQIAHLSLENEKSEAKTREELIRGFGDVKLDACKNTSELARQLAECCCETQKSLLTQSASIRELELKQSAQTRELALSIENNRLRDKCDNNERHSRNGDIEIAITNVLRNLNNNK